MYVKSSRRVRSTALIVAAAAIGALTTASPAQSLSGGAVSGTAYAFTAKIDIGQGDAQRSCTGALVDPYWIVTASSCFATNPQAPSAVPTGKPALKTVATIGRTDVTATSGGHVSEIVHIVPRAGRDLVMARLASPAGAIKPVVLATVPPADGEELTVAGYGRTKHEWIQGKLHAGTFKVDSSTTPSTLLSPASAGAAVCKGDAGGPVLRTLANGAFELVAVSSRSWQGGCLNETEERTGAVATRVDNTVLGTTLRAGRQLASGDSLTANSARLTMGADGNLVVASNANKTLWSTGTGGNPGAVAAFGADGNLTVKSADGSRTLWESKTSAAGGKAVLQHRGNLVIQDAAGKTQWAAGTVIRHDYDGDGRSDMAGWYDHADGRDRIRTFTGKADGGFDSPLGSWEIAAGNYDAASMKRTTGDFNGDGLGDIASFYAHADGRVALRTWLGKGDGNFANPLLSWISEPKTWTFSRIIVQAGDFNGDGRDDIATWYDYADGSDRIHTFLSKADGGFAAPFSSFYRADGWNASAMKFVTGDYNADGRDDLATLYEYATGDVKLITFTAKPDGGFNDVATHGWESSGWNAARASVHSGDLDGDGRDDIAVWYDYADGHDGVITFTASGEDGKFGNRREVWTAPAERYWRVNMQIVTGDYNGDGRDDLGALYGYADGRVKAFTWTAKPDGSLNEALGSWETPTGVWTFDRFRTIEGYNSP